MLRNTEELDWTLSFSDRIWNNVVNRGGKKSEEKVWGRRREGDGEVSLGYDLRATWHHWVPSSCLLLCVDLMVSLLNHLLCFQVNHHPWLSRSHAPAQAVVKQPVRGASGRTTITTVVQTGGDWSTGLFSVFRDRKICMFFLFIYIPLYYFLLQDISGWKSYNKQKNRN